MRSFVLSLALVLSLCFTPAHAQSSVKPGILSAADVEKLMPAQVFFHSQTATVQMRNSAAIRYADGTVTLAGLVDTSGYSSAQRETYQFYLLTDVTLTVAGQRIAPGAYGCGFVQDRGLVVMDLGGHELLHAPVSKDASLGRPRPLQMLPDAQAASAFRLYLGREFVTVTREK